jgi:hypothetical protein
MLTSARLVLKHHRFEVGAAAILGLLAAAAALVISYRLTSIGVPAGCFEQWLTGGGAEGAGDCAGPVQAFAQINEDEAGKLLAFMAVLPFIVGLLAGVSIVSRELESRTAQLGWALTPSRHRWLARQVGPILLVIVVVVALAAAAASVLEATREPWYHSTFGDLSLHGWPVLGRAVAAFSIGLLVGAVIGRSLPALIVAAVLCVLLLVLEGMATQAWYQANYEVIADPTALSNGTFDGIYGGIAWRTPDGQSIGQEAVFQQVPSGVDDPNQWLLDHGYTMVTLGIPSTRADELAALQTAGFLAVGLVVGLITIPVVDRRRPV